MSRITKAARMRSCSVRLQGCENARETVVFAHAPSIDKGMGYKSPDFWGAFACHHCHDLLDGRKGTLQNAAPYWLRAIYETQKQLVDEGIIVL